MKKKNRDWVERYGRWRGIIFSYGFQSLDLFVVMSFVLFFWIGVIFAVRFRLPSFFLNGSTGLTKNRKKISHLLHQHFFYTSLIVLLEYVSKERPIRFRSKVHSSSFKGCLGIKFDSFKGFLGAKF